MSDEINNDKPAPCGKRQWMYTNPNGADVTFFGGAAGSGKSEIAVIDFCQYVRIPNFIGIISRRTNPMLKGAGGILTKCKRTFAKEFKNDPDYTFNWKEKDGKFVFYKREKQVDGRTILVPISEVYLKHSEHEALIEEYWQGVEANLIVLDESLQYTLPMISYIMSRMRNPSCPQVPPKLKLTGNPDYRHFLRKWVEPFLKEDGTPDRSKDGLIRYFQMLNGDFFFADTPEEVMEKVSCERKDVLTFTFIGANCSDNKILQEADPRYVSWLKGLKGVDRERLLRGSWYAREVGASYWDRKTCPELEYPPSYSEFSKIVRVYDLAGSLPTDANRSPDYTASVKMGKLKTGDYVVLEVTRHRITFGSWLPHILEHARRDGKKVDIVIPQDPNPSAKANAVSLARSINDEGFHATTKRSAQGKLETFKPFSASSQIGVISIVKDCGIDYWNKINGDNEFFYAELEAFDGTRRSGESGHDDVADCMGLAYSYLASKINLGNSFLHGIKNTDLSNKSGLLQIGR